MEAKFSDKSSTHVSKVGGNQEVFEHVVANMNRIDDIKLALRAKTKEELGKAAVMLTSPE